MPSPSSLPGPDHSLVERLVFTCGVFWKENDVCVLEWPSGSIDVVHGSFVGREVVKKDDTAARHLAVELA